MFDFGYGMGTAMYNNGEYTFESRGVMNNISDALLIYPEKASSWSAMKEQLSPVIDEVLNAYSAPVQ